MLFLKMKGPYKLDTDMIYAKVTRKSPGNYILGRRNLSGQFRAGYVGRSDSDIAAVLKSRACVTKQLFFKFNYAKSPETVFERECKLYHDLPALGNYSHPTLPKGGPGSARYVTSSTRAQLGKRERALQGEGSEGRLTQT